MNLGVAVLLGVLQGLTEFLPVSSSGHLALAQLLVPGFSQPGVVFDAMLHVGTAAAVVWYERGEIRRWLTPPGGRRLLGLLVIALLVAILIPTLAKARRQVRRTSKRDLSVSLPFLAISSARLPP